MGTLWLFNVAMENGKFIGDVPIAVELPLSSIYLWVDLRENLQETIDFPMNDGIVLYFFP